MGQTPEGAKKAAQTAKLIHGEDHHRAIGSKGGRKSNNNLTTEEAKERGRKGGRNKKGYRKKDEMA